MRHVDEQPALSETTIPSRVTAGRSRVAAKLACRSAR
jgi:hypothetical protein